MLRNTGDIGLPTIMLAYLLNISFVAKSILLSRYKNSFSFDANPLLQVTLYFIAEPFSNIVGRVRIPICFAGFTSITVLRRR